MNATKKYVKLILYCKNNKKEVVNLARQKRSNGEGSWTKRTDGSWRLRMTYDGKSKEFYGKTKPEVNAKRKAFEALRNNTNKISQSAITVEQYTNEWMSKVQKNRLKKKSFDRLFCTLNNWIVPIIGDIQIDKVETIDVQTSIIDAMYEQNLSRSSIKQARNALNSMYKYAVATKKVSFNPITAVNIPSVDKFDKKEIRYFSKDERSRFVDACYAQYNNGKYVYNYGAFFVLMLYTGLRIGEALALKWKDIDLEARKIHVNNTIIVVSNEAAKEDNDFPRWIIEEQAYTKTNRARYIYICDMAFEALNIIKQRYGDNPNSYIINYENGPINPRRAARVFKAICKRANIENATPHCLRHSCASLMHSNRIPLSMISEYLGHANEATTAKIYIHLLADDKIASQAIIKNMM